MTPSGPPSNPPDSIPVPAEPLESMRRTHDALSSSALLKDVTITRPHSLILALRRNDALLLVVPATVWKRGRDLLQPYWDRSASGQARLIILGSLRAEHLEEALQLGVSAVLPYDCAEASLVIAVINALNAIDLQTTSMRGHESLSRYRYEVGELVDIARMLSTVQETDKLLSLILEKARFITGADAGSIYVIEGDSSDLKSCQLRFKLTQNDSVQFDWREFTVPVSPQSIAGACALSLMPINIEDVYHLPAGTPFAVDRSFDERTGYKTKSMLCVPLVNRTGRVIGVLQLINKKPTPGAKLRRPEDTDRLVIAFDERSQTLLEALASQAGVSLENVMLYEEIVRIFEGFVFASVEAIEQRDPSTSGHSRRVATLSVALAETISLAGNGPYRDVRFSAQDLQELRFASLLHDFGKIGVRERVLVKAKKLYPEDLERIRLRFDFAISRWESLALTRKLEAVSKGATPASLDDLDRELDSQKAQIEMAWQSLLLANEPSVLAEHNAVRLEDLSSWCFPDLAGHLNPLLMPHEVTNLRVPRGSLNSSEVDEIRSHVTHTRRFLERIPWGTALRGVPKIAGCHHERLNGTGYPQRLRAEEIPLQSKIMAVADIFDALTAHDRAYKKAVPLERAISILDAEALDEHIDGELVRAFCEARLWEHLRDPSTQP